MEERKSFVEKYAENKSDKKRSFKIKLPKLKFRFPKINQDLFFKYFVFLVTITVAFSCFYMNLNKPSDTINRYDIVNSGLGLTILMDKKTGLTWRNVWCDDKEKIPKLLVKDGLQ